MAFTINWYSSHFPVFSGTESIIYLEEIKIGEMIPHSEYALRDNSRFPIFCSFSLFLLSLVTKRLSYSQCHTMIRLNLVQKKILIFNNGIF